MTRLTPALRAMLELVRDSTDGKRFAVRENLNNSRLAQPKWRKLIDAGYVGGVPDDHGNESLILITPAGRRALRMAGGKQ